MRKDIKAAIRTGKPIKQCGLIFYPITMDNYEDFIACKDALLLRTGTLPVKYLSKDFLSAIWSMEIDALKSNGKAVGLFERVMRFVGLSLKVNLFDNKRFDNVLRLKRVGEETVLDALIIKQGGKTTEITPFVFSTTIRPILAEQNGLTLPDESQNVDIIKDYERRRAMGSDRKLKHNIEDLIASVAFQSRIREQDINEWTVREFENRVKCITRDKRYTMFGQAELSGMVKFKSGNPVPSWCFDVADDSFGTMGLSKLGEIFDNNN